MEQTFFIEQLVSVNYHFLREIMADSFSTELQFCGLGITLRRLKYHRLTTLSEFFKNYNILRLHSKSSVWIPSPTRKFLTMFPSIETRPLNILSASSINLHGTTNSNVFHNNLRIRLSPLQSSILR